MKISELTIRQGNVDVEGTIKEMGEVKTFDKFGKELRVADAALEDDSGTIKLSLWNDDIDKFKQGDKVKITNGYVNEFQGEKQLTSGKFGKIEKADGESSTDDEIVEDEIEKVEDGEETVKEAEEEIAEDIAEKEEDATI